MKFKDLADLNRQHIYAGCCRLTRYRELQRLQLTELPAKRRRTRIKSTICQTCIPNRGKERRRSSCHRRSCHRWLCHRSSCHKSSCRIRSCRRRSCVKRLVYFSKFSLLLGRCERPMEPLTSDATLPDEPFMHESRLMPSLADFFCSNDFSSMIDSTDVSMKQFTWNSSIDDTIRRQTTTHYKI